MNRLELFVLILLMSFGCECAERKAPVPEISERQRQVNYIRDHITVIEYPHEKCYVYRDLVYGYVTGGISCVSYEAFDK